MSGIKKRWMVIAVLASIVTGIVFVGFNIWRFSWEVSKQIEDQNGDDKTPCVITDEMIQKYTMDYRAIKRSIRSTDTHSSGVKGKFEDHDNGYTKTKIGKLSGIYVCNAVLGSGKDVTWKVTSAVTSGNMRIVITDENNAILQDLPIDATAEATVFCESGKMYYVKFVAESAEFTSELWREIAP